MKTETKTETKTTAASEAPNQHTIVQIKPEPRLPSSPYVPRKQRVREAVERVVRERLPERWLRAKPFMEWITGKVQNADDLEDAAHAACTIAVVSRVRKASDAMIAARMQMQTFGDPVERATEELEHAEAHRAALRSSIGAHTELIRVRTAEGGQEITVAQLGIEHAAMKRELAEINTRDARDVIKRAEAAVHEYCRLLDERNRWAARTRHPRFTRKRIDADILARDRVPAAMHRFIPVPAPSAPEMDMESLMDMMAAPSAPEMDLKIEPPPYSA